MRLPCIACRVHLTSVRQFTLFPLCLPSVPPAFWKNGLSFKMKQKLIHFYFETTTEVFVLKTRPVSCFSDFLQQNSHIDSCVKLALRKGWKSDMQTWRQWTHSNWLMNVLVFASTQRRGTVDGPVVTRHKTCFQQRRDYSFNDCLHNTTNPLVSYLFHSGIWTWRKEEIQYEIIISSDPSNT